MKGQMTDKIRVQHILDAIAEIETYLTNVSLDDFFSNSEKRFATIKQIEIIGEACNHITNDIKQAHSEIEWISINGFRNISVHEYFGINVQIVWEIAKSDLPVLKEKFNQILQEL
jgi:uncharacterized protein with HEPN domain